MFRLNVPDDYVLVLRPRPADKTCSVRACARFSRKTNISGKFAFHTIVKKLFGNMCGVT